MIRRTKSGLPQHCYYITDRHGKRRVRFINGLFTAYLPGAPWTSEFMVHYGHALEGAKPEPGTIGMSRTKPGSISALLVRFYGSPEFRAGNEQTQHVGRLVLERFRNEHGDDLVRDLKREHVSAIIGRMAKTPAAANRLLNLLKRMLDLGVVIGMIPSSPAAGVKSYSKKTPGFHTWTEDEIGLFEARHPVGTKPRLAFALMLFTAQRKSDAVRLGWQHLKAGRLEFRQEKTSELLSIKVHPALEEALCAASRAHLTFLVTEYDRPFTANGFGNRFREWCNEAGLRHCSAHGLRKAAARRLAEAGMSANEIASVTGHTTLTEVSRYTRAADQKKLSDRAIDTMPMRAEGEQILSNLDGGLEKTVPKPLNRKEAI